MDADYRVTIGPQDGEHLTVEPIRRNQPECNDYSDGNWLACAIDVKVGGFRGHVDADLRAEEFASFRNGLQRLYNQLDGEVTFETVEQWLTIHVAGDGRGHFEATCQLRDEPGMGNRLAFSLAFDQTYLPAVLRSLEAILHRFPVVGRP